MATDQHPDEVEAAREVLRRLGETRGFVLVVMDMNGATDPRYYTDLNQMGVERGLLHINSGRPLMVRTLLGVDTAEKEQELLTKVPS